MTAKSKKEIPHEELAKKQDGDNQSARYKALGTEEMVKMQGSDGQINEIGFKIKDIIAYEPNFCPYCESENSYHRRIQQNGDKIGNIWRHQQFLNSEGTDLVSMKFDFCLDCRKEFVMEIFILEKA